VNQWNHPLEFIWSFIAIDHNTQNSQILLGRPALKDFKINICNNIDSWEFEWKSHVTEISAHCFVKELASTAHVFEVWTAYRSCLDSNDEIDLWEDDCNSSDNLTNVLKRLCVKYHDFFNTWKVEQLASHQTTNHVIELKSNTESSYMHIYNMFSAELKALKIYINDFLSKEWICESQSPADASILFVLRKSDELCLCINYHELNVIIIKNYYLLSLISELLDWVDDSTVFSKIDL